MASRHLRIEWLRMGNLQTFCLPYALFYAQQDLPKFLVSSAALRQIVSPGDANPNLAGRLSPIGQSWSSPAGLMVSWVQIWVHLVMFELIALAFVSCLSE